MASLPTKCRLSSGGDRTPSEIFQAKIEGKWTEVQYVVHGFCAVGPVKHDYTRLSGTNFGEICLFCLFVFDA